MAIERMAPDAILEQTNLSGAVTAIDEDPDSADASWLTAASNNAATVVRVSFPTPTNFLTSGAGLQEFRVQVRKISGQSGNPTCRVELYENGSLISTVVADTTITSTTGTVLSGTWNASGRTASQIECRVVGTQTGGSPGTRNTVEVGAIEWNADTSASSPGTATANLVTLTLSALPATAFVPGPIEHTEYYAGFAIGGQTNPLITITGISWNPGDLIIVYLTGREADGPLGQTVSDNGPGENYVEVSPQYNTVQDILFNQLWAATAVGTGTNADISIQVTEDNIVTDGGYQIEVFVIPDGAIDDVTIAETGATDTAAPTIDHTTVEATTRVYYFFNTRNRVFTPDSGDGLTAIRENAQAGASGSISSISSYYKDETTAGSKNASGTTTSALDWLAMAVSVKVADAGTPGNATGNLVTVTASPQASVATGEGQATAALPAVTSSPLAATGKGEAVASASLVSLSITALPATATGEGQATAGLASIGVNPLAATAEGDPAGDVELGTSTRSNNGESQSLLSATTMPTHATGDTLVAISAWKGSTGATPTTPDGWDLVDSIISTPHSTVDVRLAVYTKIAESASEAFSLQLSANADWNETHVWRLSAAEAGTPVTLDDTGEDTTYQVPALTFSPSGVGQVLTVVASFRGDRGLTALAAQEGSQGGFNTSWAPYFALLSMFDAFEGTDPASTSGSITNGADTSIALRVGFAGVGSAVPGTASANLVTANLNALASAATGEGQATAGLASVASSPLAAVASGKAQASAGLAAVSVTALPATANGVAVAQAGLASISSSPLSASASGAAVAGGALQSVAASALAPSASGAATAGANLVPATLSVLPASGTGEAVASAGLVVLSVTPLHANAGGGSSIPGTADANLVSLSLTPMSATTSGAAVASASTPTLTITPLSVVSSGAAVAVANLVTVNVQPLSATAAGGGSAVAQTNLVTLALSALPATATGEAQTTAGLASVSISALAASASGGSAVPGTASAGLVSLSVTPLSATAHGEARAQQGLTSIGVEPLSATAVGAAVAAATGGTVSAATLGVSASGAAQTSVGLVGLTISPLSASATGCGDAATGLPVIGVIALPATPSSPGTAQAGLATITLTVLAPRYVGPPTSLHGIGAQLATLLGATESSPTLRGRTVPEPTLTGTTGSTESA